jgi:hypothetical protein
MFLKEFVEQTPWIHLDIAGTAWMDDNKAWIAQGPSGVAVRTLIEFVRTFENSPSAGNGSSKQSSGTAAAQKRADLGTGL